MKRIIASILAAGAGTLALAGTANAAEPCAPQAQVQKVDYDAYRFREHERFEREQARRRYLEHLRLERLRERGYGYGRW